MSDCRLFYDGKLSEYCSGNYGTPITAKKEYYLQMG